MKITVDDINSFVPYILNGYELVKEKIHPAGYDITVNKYCIEKINEMDIKYPILLKTSTIDYLPPMLEEKWLLGTFSIFEFLKKGVKVTVVSASDYIAKLWDYPRTDDYPEMVDLQDNLEIIIPLWFFEDETYSALDPTMPNFGYRLVMFEYLHNRGVNVKPYFNPLPEFAEETKKAKDIFYQKFPDVQPNVFKQAEMRYILEDDQIEMWKKMKEKNISVKAPRDYF